jgi:myo-inositol-1(or 4)-monophosphatase
MQNLPVNISIMYKACMQATRAILRDFSELEQLQASKPFSVGSFAKAADLKAEKVIMQQLQRARPEYSMLLEEQGEFEAPLSIGKFKNMNILDDFDSNIITKPRKKVDINKNYRWIVDPIDGTSNFSHANPNFAISIALEERDQVSNSSEIIAGVIYCPISREFFWAERGAGAYCVDVNGKQIRLRVANSAQRINSLMLATILPHRNFSAYNSILKILQKKQAKVRISGSIALDMSYLAMGRFDVVLVLEPNPWDWAAGSIIVMEAGGKISNLCAPQLKLEKCEQLMICGNGDLLRQLMQEYQKSENV